MPRQTRPAALPVAGRVRRPAPRWERSWGAFSDLSALPPGGVVGGVAGGILGSELGQSLVSTVKNWLGVGEGESPAQQKTMQTLLASMQQVVAAIPTGGIAVDINVTAMPRPPSGPVTATSTAACPIPGR